MNAAIAVITYTIILITISPSIIIISCFSFILNVSNYSVCDNENGEEYLSEVPGTLGGNKRLKIYGRLDCSSANKWIEKGYYIQNRVFFLNEETAIKAGYRPCAVCMRKEYEEWKKENNLIKTLKK